MSQYVSYFVSSSVHPFNGHGFRVSPLYFSIWKINGNCNNCYNVQKYVNEHGILFGRAFVKFIFMETLFWKRNEQCKLLALIRTLNRIWAIKEVQLEDYTVGEWLTILVRHSVVMCHNHSYHKVNKQQYPTRGVRYVVSEGEISRRILSLRDLIFILICLHHARNTAPVKLNIVTHGILFGLLISSILFKHCSAKALIRS